MRFLPIFLVIICTLLTAFAEYLWKINSGSGFSLFESGILFGFALYGLGAVLMILALSKGELSILYPMLSLTFVWGFLLSIIILHEPVYPTKFLGYSVVVAGVIILGRAR